MATQPAIAQAIKVAFIGDQGVAPSAQRVLELIRDDQAELLLIQGDLGYEQDAAAQWIENIDTILGKDFPVLMVVGNHENYEWPTYWQWQKDKLERVPVIRCEGDVSVKAYCTYKDLGVVQVSPGIMEVEGIDGNDDYAGYITAKFSEDPSTWRICSWHKNMRDMQVGGKGDSTGWAVYQSCLAQGAIVLNGHEHSYSRTYLMSSFEDKTVIHTNNDMDIGPNSSISIVSGLGGREIRPQRHGGDWFASIYTASQNANNGVLFCEFNNDKADCYMKDVAGLVPDTFTLTSLINTSVEPGEPANNSTENDSNTQDSTGNVPVTDTQPEASDPLETDTQANNTELPAPVTQGDSGEQVDTDIQANAGNPPATETDEQSDEITAIRPSQSELNVQPPATPFVPSDQPELPTPDNTDAEPQSVMNNSPDSANEQDSGYQSPSPSGSAQIPTVFLNNDSSNGGQSVPVASRHVNVDGGGSLGWLCLLALFVERVIRRPTATGYFRSG